MDDHDLAVETYGDLGIAQGLIFRCGFQICAG
jgi:hypothetical protein